MSVEPDGFDIDPSKHCFRTRAYTLFLEAIEFAQEARYADSCELPEGDLHVTPQEICSALFVLAFDQFGLLTMTVLSELKLSNCLEIEQIARELLAAKQLTLDSSESLSGFSGCFDFESAFVTARDSFDFCQYVDAL